MASALDTLLKQIYDDTKEMDVKAASVYFERAKAANVALANETLEGFAEYWLTKEAMERQQKLNIPIPTAEDLWTALARSSPFAPVPLGKLHGNIMCALEPEDCIGSDIETYTPGREGFALSPSFYDAICAINYADGHPSENEYLLKRLATEDKTLRQFVSLGWVMIKTNGPWIKTGHALVIDASHHRKCHPWFVSARQLETDSEDDFQKYDTDIMEPATKVKKKNDRNALGVFPGNNNRTPIARLTHFGWAPEGEEKFVSHFGVDFNFEFDRLVGIPDDEIRGEWGPDLVQILDWWWDPIKQEEVCYTHDEKECMRYNPSTREYNDPHALLEERVGIILED